MQDFYSDGAQFAFTCITANGVVEESEVFQIIFEGSLKMPFNLISSLLSGNDYEKHSECIAN